MRRHEAGNAHLVVDARRVVRSRGAYRHHRAQHQGELAHFAYHFLFHLQKEYDCIIKLNRRQISICSFHTVSTVSVMTD